MFTIKTLNAISPVGLARMRNELLGTMCRPGTGMHQGLRVTCCGSSLSRMK